MDAFDLQIDLYGPNVANAIDFGEGSQGHDELLPPPKRSIRLMNNSSKHAYVQVSEVPRAKGLRMMVPERNGLLIRPGVVLILSPNERVEVYCYIESSGTEPFNGNLCFHVDGTAQVAVQLGYRTHELMPSVKRDVVMEKLSFESTFDESIGSPVTAKPSSFLSVPPNSAEISAILELSEIVNESGELNEKIDVDYLSDDQLGITEMSNVSRQTPNVMASPDVHQPHPTYSSGDIGSIPGGSESSTVSTVRFGLSPPLSPIVPSTIRTHTNHALPVFEFSPPKNIISQRQESITPVASPPVFGAKQHQPNTDVLVFSPPRHTPKFRDGRAAETSGAFADVPPPAVLSEQRFHREEAPSVPLQPVAAPMIFSPPRAIAPSSGFSSEDFAAREIVSSKARSRQGVAWEMSPPPAPLWNQQMKETRSIQGRTSSSEHIPSKPSAMWEISPPKRSPTQPLHRSPSPQVRPPTYVASSTARSTPSTPAQNRNFAIDAASSGAPPPVMVLSGIPPPTPRVLSRLNAIASSPIVGGRGNSAMMLDSSVSSQLGNIAPKDVTMFTPMSSSASQKSVQSPRKMHTTHDNATLNSSTNYGNCASSAPSPLLAPPAAANNTPRKHYPVLEFSPNIHVTGNDQHAPSKSIKGAQPIQGWTIAATSPGGFASPHVNKRSPHLVDARRLLLVSTPGLFRKQQKPVRTRKKSGLVLEFSPPKWDKGERSDLPANQSFGKQSATYNASQSSVRYLPEAPNNALISNLFANEHRKLVFPSTMHSATDSSTSFLSHLHQHVHPTILAAVEQENLRSVAPADSSALSPSFLKHAPAPLFRFHSRKKRQRQSETGTVPAVVDPSNYNSSHLSTMTPRANKFPLGRSSSAAPMLSSSVTSRGVMVYGPNTTGYFAREEHRIGSVWYNSIMPPTIALFRLSNASMYPYYKICASRWEKMGLLASKLTPTVALDFPASRSAESIDVTLSNRHISYAMKLLQQANDQIHSFARFTQERLENMFRWIRGQPHVHSASMSLEFLADSGTFAFVNENNHSVMRLLTGGVGGHNASGAPWKSRPVPDGWREKILALADALHPAVAIHLMNYLMHEHPLFQSLLQPYLRIFYNEKGNVRKDNKDGKSTMRQIPSFPPVTHLTVQHIAARTFLLQTRISTEATQWDRAGQFAVRNGNLSFVDAHNNRSQLNQTGNTSIHLSAHYTSFQSQNPLFSPCKPAHLPAASPLVSPVAGSRGLLSPVAFQFAVSSPGPAFSTPMAKQPPQPKIAQPSNHPMEILDTPLHTARRSLYRKSRTSIRAWNQKDRARQEKLQRDRYMANAVQDLHPVPTSFRGSSYAMPNKHVQANGWINDINLTTTDTYGCSLGPCTIVASMRHWMQLFLLPQPSIVDPTQSAWKRVTESSALARLFLFLQYLEILHQLLSGNIGGSQPKLDKANAPPEVLPSPQEKSMLSSSLSLLSTLPQFFPPHALASLSTPESPSLGALHPSVCSRYERIRMLALATGMTGLFEPRLFVTSLTGTEKPSNLGASVLNVIRVVAKECFAPSAPEQRQVLYQLLSGFSLHPTAAIQATGTSLMFPIMDKDMLRKAVEHEKRIDMHHPVFSFAKTSELWNFLGELPVHPVMHNQKQEITPYYASSIAKLLKIRPTHGTARALSDDSMSSHLTFNRANARTISDLVPRSEASSKYATANGSTSNSFVLALSKSAIAHPLLSAFANEVATNLRPLSLALAVYSRVNTSLHSAEQQIRELLHTLLPKLRHLAPTSADQNALWEAWNFSRTAISYAILSELLIVQAESRISMDNHAIIDEILSFLKDSPNQEPFLPLYTLFPVESKPSVRELQNPRIFAQVLSDYPASLLLLEWIRILGWFYVTKEVPASMEIKHWSALVEAYLLSQPPVPLHTRYKTQLKAHIPYPLRDGTLLCLFVSHYYPHLLPRSEIHWSTLSALSQHTLSSTASVATLPESTSTSFLQRALSFEQKNHILLSLALAGLEIDPLMIPPQTSSIHPPSPPAVIALLYALHAGFRAHSAAGSQQVSPGAAAFSSAPMVRRGIDPATAVRLESLGLLTRVRMLQRWIRKEVLSPIRKYERRVHWAKEILTGFVRIILAKDYKYLLQQERLHEKQQQARRRRQKMERLVQSFNGVLSSLHMVTSIAASKIAATYRAWYTRRQYLSLLHSVTRLQAQVRGRQAWLRYVLYRFAVFRIQRNWRLRNCVKGLVAVISARVQLKQLVAHLHALQMQPHAHALSMPPPTSFLSRLAAAGIVFAPGPTFHSYRIATAGVYVPITLALQELMDLTHVAAAIVIQRTYRGWVRAMQQRERHVAALVIQGFFKHLLHRKMVEQQQHIASANGSMSVGQDVLRQHGSSTPVQLQPSQHNMSVHTPHTSSTHRLPETFQSPHSPHAPPYSARTSTPPSRSHSATPHLVNRSWSTHSAPRNDSMMLDPVTHYRASNLENLSNDGNAMQMDSMLDFAVTSPSTKSATDPTLFVSPVKQGPEHTFHLSPSPTSALPHLHEELLHPEPDQGAAVSSAASHYSNTSLLPQKLTFTEALSLQQTLPPPPESTDSDLSTPTPSLSTPVLSRSQTPLSQTSASSPSSASGPSAAQAPPITPFLDSLRVSPTSQATPNACVTSATPKSSGIGPGMSVLKHTPAKSNTPVTAGTTGSPAVMGSPVVSIRSKSTSSAPLFSGVKRPPTESPPTPSFLRDLYSQSPLTTADIASDVKAWNSPHLTETLNTPSRSKTYGNHQSVMSTTASYMPSTPVSKTLPMSSSGYSTPASKLALSRDLLNSAIQETSAKLQRVRSPTTSTSSTTPATPAPNDTSSFAWTNVFGAAAGVVAATDAASTVGSGLSFPHSHQQHGDKPMSGQPQTLLSKALEHAHQLAGASAFSAIQGRIQDVFKTKPTPNTPSPLVPTVSTSSTSNGLPQPISPPHSAAPSKTFAEALNDPYMSSSRSTHTTFNNPHFPQSGLTPPPLIPVSNRPTPHSPHTPRTVYNTPVTHHAQNTPRLSGTPLPLVPSHIIRSTTGTPAGTLAGSPAQGNRHTSPVTFNAPNSPIAPYSPQLQNYSHIPGSLTTPQHKCTCSVCSNASEFLIAVTEWAQANYRMLRVRRLFLYLREHTIRIQRWWRAYLHYRNHQRPLLEPLSQNVDYIAPEPSVSLSYLNSPQPFARHRSPPQQSTPFPQAPPIQRSPVHRSPVHIGTPIAKRLSTTPAASSIYTPHADSVPSLPVSEKTQTHLHSPATATSSAPSMQTPYAPHFHRQPSYTPYTPQQPSTSHLETLPSPHETPASILFGVPPSAHALSTPPPPPPKSYAPLSTPGTSLPSFHEYLRLTPLSKFQPGASNSSMTSPHLSTPPTIPIPPSLTISTSPSAPPKPSLALTTRTRVRSLPPTGGRLNTVRTSTHVSHRSTMNGPTSGIASQLPKRSSSASARSRSSSLPFHSRGLRSALQSRPAIADTWTNAWKDEWMESHRADALAEGSAIARLPLVRNKSPNVEKESLLRQMAQRLQKVLPSTGNGGNIRYLDANLGSGTIATRYHSLGTASPNVKGGRHHHGAYITDMALASDQRIFPESRIYPTRWMTIGGSEMRNNKEEAGGAEIVDIEQELEHVMSHAPYASAVRGLESPKNIQHTTRTSSPNASATLHVSSPQSPSLSRSILRSSSAPSPHAKSYLMNQSRDSGDSFLGQFLSLYEAQRQQFARSAAGDSDHQLGNAKLSKNFIDTQDIPSSPAAVQHHPLALEWKAPTPTSKQHDGEDQDSRISRGASNIQGSSAAFASDAFLGNSDNATVSNSMMRLINDVKNIKEYLNTLLMQQNAKSFMQMESWTQKMMQQIDVNLRTSIQQFETKHTESLESLQRALDAMQSQMVQPTESETIVQELGNDGSIDYPQLAHTDVRNEAYELASKDWILGSPISQPLHVTSPFQPLPSLDKSMYEKGVQANERSRLEEKQAVRSTAMAVGMKGSENEHSGSSFHRLQDVHDFLRDHDGQDLSTASRSPALKQVLDETLDGNLEGTLDGGRSVEPTAPVPTASLSPPVSSPSSASLPSKGYKPAPLTTPPLRLVEPSADVPVTYYPSIPSRPITVRRVIIPTLPLEPFQSATSSAQRIAEMGAPMDLDTTLEQQSLLLANTSSLSATSFGSHMRGLSDVSGLDLSIHALPQREPSHLNGPNSMLPPQHQLQYPAIGPPNPYHDTLLAEMQQLRSVLQQMLLSVDPRSPPQPTNSSLQPWAPAASSHTQHRHAPFSLTFPDSSDNNNLLLSRLQHSAQGENPSGQPLPSLSNALLSVAATRYLRRQHSHSRSHSSPSPISHDTSTLLLPHRHRGKIRSDSTAVSLSSYKSLPGSGLAPSVVMPAVKPGPYHHRRRSHSSELIYLPRQSRSLSPRKRGGSLNANKPSTALHTTTYSVPLHSSSQPLLTFPIRTTSSAVSSVSPNAFLPVPSNAPPVPALPPRAPSQSNSSSRPASPRLPGTFRPPFPRFRNMDSKNKAMEGTMPPSTLSEVPDTTATESSAALQSFSSLPSKPIGAHQSSIRVEDEVTRSDADTGASTTLEFLPEQRQPLDRDRIEGDNVFRPATNASSSPLLSGELEADITFVSVSEHAPEEQNTLQDSLLPQLPASVANGSRSIISDVPFDPQATQPSTPPPITSSSHSRTYSMLHTPESLSPPSPPKDSPISIDRAYARHDNSALQNLEMTMSVLSHATVDQLSSGIENPEMAETADANVARSIDELSKEAGIDGNAFNSPSQEELDAVSKIQEWYKAVVIGIYTRLCVQKPYETPAVPSFLFRTFLLSSLSNEPFNEPMDLAEQSDIFVRESLHLDHTLRIKLYTLLHRQKMRRARMLTMYPVSSHSIPSEIMNTREWRAFLESVYGKSLYHTPLLSRFQFSITQLFKAIFILETLTKPIQDALSSAEEARPTDTDVASSGKSSNSASFMTLPKLVWNQYLLMVQHLHAIVHHLYSLEFCVQFSLSAQELVYQLPVYNFLGKLLELLTLPPFDALTIYSMKRSLLSNSRTPSSIESSSSAGLGPSAPEHGFFFLQESDSGSSALNTDSELSVYFDAVKAMEALTYTILVRSLGLFRLFARKKTPVPTLSDTDTYNAESAADIATVNHAQSTNIVFPYKTQFILTLVRLLRLFYHIFPIAYPILRLLLHVHTVQPRMRTTMVNEKEVLKALQKTLKFYHSQIGQEEAYERYLSAQNQDKQGEAEEMDSRRKFDFERVDQETIASLIQYNDGRLGPSLASLCVPISSTHLQLYELHSTLAKSRKKETFEQSFETHSRNLFGEGDLETISQNSKYLYPYLPELPITKQRILTLQKMINTTRELAIPITRLRKYLKLRQKMSPGNEQ